VKFLSKTNQLKVLFRFETLSNDLRIFARRRMIRSPNFK